MTGSGREVAEAPRGASVGEFDAALMELLESHLTEEGALLEHYRGLANSPDEAVRYIAQLIIDDEQRHHQLLTEMLNRFKTSAWFVDQEPHVPFFTRSADPRGLKESVRKLRAFERHDLRQLRKLERRLGFLRRESINGVLVRALIMDTRKHLAYLRALNRLAGKK